MTQVFVDKKEAAKILGVSVRSIDAYRQRGIIPCHVIGGKLVRFVPDEIIRWALGCDDSLKKDSTEPVQE